MAIEKRQIQTDSVWMIFLRHLKIHAGIKSFQCSVCDRAFSENAHLKGHMRTHTGENPYQCSQCGKVFQLLLVLETI